MNHNKSYTWLDRFPTEIIFDIFEYLLCNDILYTFFNLNQRFNNLLIQYQHYSTYLEFPTSNMNFWENIFLSIGEKIHSIKITSNNTIFPFKFFPNLKSLTIFLSQRFSDEYSTSLFENYQFLKLHTLKLKQTNIISIESYFPNQNYLFEKLFNHQKTLETFEYTSNLITFPVILTNNFNLRSLTLILDRLMDILIIFEYTPNLIYLNLISFIPFIDYQRLLFTRVKLKEFHLTIKQKFLMNNYLQIDFKRFRKLIKLFSLSLICLSMNLVNWNFHRADTFPFDGIQLEKKLLNSMIELKQFHFYAKIPSYKNILSTFKSQFWLDHNWFVGMHGDYIYTLPFHFNELKNFDNVKTTNDKILRINPRLYPNVTSIELSELNKFDLKQLQMPNLKLIKLNSIYSEIDITDITDLTLYQVTIINLIGGYMENVERWLINVLPNLKHLILSGTKLPSVESELASILNEKIERLDIDTFSIFEQFTRESYVYFSNLQEIRIIMPNGLNISQWYADVMIKLMKYLKKLKILSIFIYKAINNQWGRNPEEELREIFACIDMNQIEEYFEAKCYSQQMVFSKIYNILNFQ